MSRNLMPTAVTVSLLKAVYFLGICDHHHFVANPVSSFIFTVVSQPNFIVAGTPVSVLLTPWFNSGPQIP